MYRKLLMSIILTLSTHVSAKSFLDAMVSCDVPELSKQLNNGFNVNSLIELPNGSTKFRPIDLLEMFTCIELGKDDEQMSAFIKSKKLEIKNLLKSKGAVSEINTRMSDRRLEEDKVKYSNIVLSCDLPEIRKNLDKYNATNTFLLKFAFEADCETENEAQELLRFLVERGADVNQLYRDDEVAKPNFFYAAEEYPERVAFAINELKASPYALNELGCGLATDEQYSLQEIKNLFDAGMVPGQRCLNGMNIFYQMRDKKIFDYLLSQQVDPVSPTLVAGSFLDYSLIEMNFDKSTDSSLELMQQRIKKAPALLNAQNLIMKQTWAMNAVKQLCPSIGYSSSPYLQFREGNEKEYSSTLPYRQKAWSWLNDILQNEDFDLEIRDARGHSLLTYALHFCPSRTVEILLNKGAQFMDKDLFAFDDLKHNDIFKGTYDYIPLNNDDKNLDLFLSHSKTDLSTLRLDRFSGVTNERLKAKIKGNKPVDFLKLEALDDFGFDEKGNITADIKLNYYARRVRGEDIATTEPITLSVNDTKTKIIPLNGHQINLIWGYKTKKGEKVRTIETSDKDYSRMEVRYIPGNKGFEAKLFYMDDPAGWDVSRKYYMDVFNGGAEVWAIAVSYVKYIYEEKAKEEEKKKIALNQANNFQQTFSGDPKTYRGEGFVSYAGSFGCESSICSYLEATSLENGKKISIKAKPELFQASTKSDKLDKILFSLSMSDHEGKRKILDDIQMGNRTDTVPYLWNFFLKADDGIQTQLNQKLLLTILKLAHTTKTSISFETLLNQINESYFPGEAKLEYLFAKYLGTGDLLSDTIRVSTQNIYALQRLHTILLQFSSKGLFSDNVKNFASSVLQDWNRVKATYPNETQLLNNIEKNLKGLL